MTKALYQRLGLRVGRPPSDHELLGVSANETDAGVIEEAALRQTMRVRAFQAAFPEASSELLNAIGRAMNNLCDLRSAPKVRKKGCRRIKHPLCLIVLPPGSRRVIAWRVSFEPVIVPGKKARAQARRWRARYGDDTNQVLVRVGNPRSKQQTDLALSPTSWQELVRIVNGNF